MKVLKNMSNESLNYPKPSRLLIVWTKNPKPVWSSIMMSKWFFVWTVTLRSQQLYAEHEWKCLQKQMQATHGKTLLDISVESVVGYWQVLLHFKKEMGHIWQHMGVYPSLTQVCVIPIKLDSQVETFCYPTALVSSSAPHWALVNIWLSTKRSLERSPSGGGCLAWGYKTMTWKYKSGENNVMTRAKTARLTLL